MDKVAEILGRCCVDKPFRDGLIAAIENRESFSALEPYELKNRECEKLRSLCAVLKNHRAKFDDLGAAIANSYTIVKCSISEEDCCETPPC